LSLSAKSCQRKRKYHTYLCIFFLFLFKTANHLHTYRAYGRPIYPFIAIF
jgi:hypothetical protein